ncbi:MAG: hypothetical protein IIU14_01430 [Ruminococcus sp.]|nr:hypothetical protein [Ruminococcus sp.]
MPEYSEQDLKYAAELREEIHREALGIVQKTRPDVTEVIDRHTVEDYFQEMWDYPGVWYTVVAVPYGHNSRKALVDTIVRNTLSGQAFEPEPLDTREDREMDKAEQRRRIQAKQLDSKPAGYRKLFTVELDRKKHVFCAVGVDSDGRYILERFEEYGLGDSVGSVGEYFVLTDLEYCRYLRLALLNGQLTEDEYDRLNTRKKKESKFEDPVRKLLSEYPELVLDYRVVRERYCGYESHRRALKSAFTTIDGDWDGDPDNAEGKSIAAEELFSSDYQKGRLNYRKAFLHPPHNNSYTGKDFVRFNAALFPNGTDGLEVFEWTTDWSDYFDDGHEWWGTLCLTVYDKTLDRFVVIMASATD